MKIKFALFSISISSFLGCRSTAPTAGELRASNLNAKIDYEVIKEARVETQYFPTRACTVPKGAIITLTTTPRLTTSNADYMIDIAEIKLGNSVATAEPASANTPAVSTPETVDYMNSGTNTNSGRLDRLLTEISQNRPQTDDSQTVESSGLELTSQNHGSAPTCKNSDSFLIEESLRIPSDALLRRNERVQSDRAPSQTLAENPSSLETGTGNTGDIRQAPSFVFPLRSLPYNDWFSGAAAFGAGRHTERGGYRQHAASDLYFGLGKDVVAIGDGEIIDYQEFYEGTSEIQQRLDDGRVIRYGEILNGSGLRIGSKVKKGQKIARIGKTYCCEPMLHFEMYSGKGRGPLSDLSSSRYPTYRRADLMNPGKFLNEHRHKLAK